MGRSGNRALGWVLAVLAVVVGAFLGAFGLAAVILLLSLAAIAAGWEGRFPLELLSIGFIAGGIGGVVVGVLWSRALLRP